MSKRHLFMLTAHEDGLVEKVYNGCEIDVPAVLHRLMVGAPAQPHLELALIDTCT